MDKQIRKDKEKESRGARRAEEAEMGSHSNSNRGCRRNDARDWIFQTVIA